MKQLEFTQPFGHYVPGDLIEVEDDAVYDTFYLKEVKPEAPAKKKDE